MPWDKAGAKRHTKKANTPEKQARWSSVANAILKKTGDEGKAIRIANSKMSAGGALKQGVGIRDTKHGLLDLPVSTRASMRGKRFQNRGLVESLKRSIGLGGKDETPEEARARIARQAEAIRQKERAAEPRPEEPKKTLGERRAEQIEKGSNMARGGKVKKYSFGGDILPRLTGPDPLKIFPASFRESPYFDPLGSKLFHNTEYDEKQKWRRQNPGMAGGGKVKKMAKGGVVKRRDGIAVRGKTRGRIV